MKHFEALGYDCTRSAGSKGAKDVVAAKAGTLLYIQCKRSGDDTNISSTEWNELLDACEVAGAVPLLATRKPNRPFKLFKILGRRKFRGRAKPMEPFTP